MLANFKLPESLVSFRIVAFSTWEPAIIFQQRHRDQKESPFAVVLDAGNGGKLSAVCFHHALSWSCGRSVPVTKSSLLTGSTGTRVHIYCFAGGLFCLASAVCITCRHCGPQSWCLQPATSGPRNCSMCWRTGDVCAVGSEVVRRREGCNRLLDSL